MKKLFIILFISIQGLVFSQQNAQVVYKVKQEKITKTVKKETAENTRVKEYYQKLSAKVYAISQYFDFILKFNNNESLYYWKEEMSDESIPDGMYNMAILKGGVFPNGKIYQNKKENLVMQQFVSPVTGKLTRETSELEKMNWKITNETDTILGYPVIKAIYGNHIAWFAPDISVPFGPSGVGGLPGLVLKYQYKIKIIYAVKIVWHKKKIRIVKPENGHLQTEKEGREKRIKSMDKIGF